MFPIERSLVKRLKDKPFTLLGVNSDPRPRAKQSLTKRNINWRSFWDGGDIHGPIATRWHVQGWPTIYILDAKGVIRFKSIGPMKNIDEKVDQLLAELKAPAPKK